MQKCIKEVFKDYNIENNLVESKIENINLYKKTNKLQLEVFADKKINIQDISSFEDFLCSKFNVAKTIIDIKYDNNIKIEQDLKDEWKNIVMYIAKKEPFSKAMLTGSLLKLEDENVNIELKIKGKNFLESKKFDKGLEHIFCNLYGNKYKVKFEENIDDNYEQKLEEMRIHEEEEARKKMYEEALIEAEHKKVIIEKQKEEQEKIKLQELEKKKEEEQKLIEKGDMAKVIEQTEDGPSPLILGRTMNLKGDFTKITAIAGLKENEEKRVVLSGELVSGSTEARTIKIKKDNSERVLLSYNVYDGSSTITCKAFIDPEIAGEVEKRLNKSKGLKIDGIAKFDSYAKEVTVMSNVIIETEGSKKEVRMDNAPLKRVELHMHTQMSQMDAVTPCADLLKRAMKWGMKSIAITDHGVVQSFPDAYHLLGVNNKDLKVIYGVEAYLVNDDVPPIVVDSKNQNIDDVTYCVLDLETTGFSPKTEKITEVGIMKVVGGKVIDKFSCFVNPEKPIPPRVVEVTKITDDMVKDAETIDKVMPKIIEFVGDSIIVAHNAKFDVGFLKYNSNKLGLKFDNTYLDTLALAKALFPDFKKYKLGAIAQRLDIEVLVAHRALDDVDTTVKVFNVMLDRLRKKDIKTLDEINDVFDLKKDPELYKKLNSYHAIILAKNYVGLKNLYKLVSISHLHYFYKKPRILKSLYKELSEGLILGSACEAGELYRAILNGMSDSEVEQIANDYDYLEIQPLGNNEYLLREGMLNSKEDLININKKIVELGETLNKPVVATCDVHFMDPEDEVYRRILMAGQKYDDADNQAPLYLRTTEEMLKEFEYLGEEKAYEVVVTNTNLISDMCENISPISPEKCAPHIPGCEEDIKNIAYEKATRLYGENLPEIVKSRLDRELNSIISNGYSVMYIIAQKLVWKSNEDGYIVGSRGSVGSSLVAFMTGITEVNSLPAHYRCPNCKFSDFTDYGVINGFDLPDKNCPKCGHKFDKDGMDIPFETFLGFKGDKEPDIDLNFSGEYQAKAHKYTEVIFGKGTTFKAGTVGTVADKTAYGYVRGYFEDRGIPVSNAEITRLSVGCTGIKRTTGQHPGGIIVVPKGREIYEFTPVQHPADDPNSDIITTHFDYHSIDQNLLKLDILGHDDPTIIRMLQDITGYDPTKVPLDDKETMSIFSSTTALRSYTRADSFRSWNIWSSRIWYTFC